ncbi:MAG: alpha/beta fold hydrolase, partial [Burkholderiales bacterium]
RTTDRANSADHTDSLTVSGAAFPEYPFASHWHTHASGLRQHYLDEGSGEVVLMLHGNPTWSYYYRHLVSALCATHRCVVPDHIGMGLSDKPDDSHYEYSLRQRVDDLDDLLRSVIDADPVSANQPLTLVLHDWGGMIGMAWAVRNPTRLARLVIMNTAAFPLPREKHMPRALTLVRNSALGAWLVLRLNEFAGVAARVAFKMPVSREVRKAYTGPYDSPANRIATLRFVQDIPLQEGDPGFDIVLNTAEHLDLLRDLPCLIAWGDRDFVFDRAFLRTWQEYFPAAELRRLEDCGHYVLEDGGQELIDTIRNFIAIKEDSSHG